MLAQIEDRISTFLAKTNNELGVELESLKIMFDLKAELFDKSIHKGSIAEIDIINFLNNYFEQKKINDKAISTGTLRGELDKNKTGDILCSVELKEDITIGIECKFDKSVRLGDIQGKDVFTNKTDTAWSQLIETDANRKSKASIIVFDKQFADSSILNFTEDLAYIHGVGFVVLIDSSRGSYANLIIAYRLARYIAINSELQTLDFNILTMFVQRIIKSTTEIAKIRKLVQSNIDNNINILQQIEKNLLLVEFTNEYFNKFLKDGRMSKKDLLDFYMGGDLKVKYSSIEKDIYKS